MNGHGDRLAAGAQRAKPAAAGALAPAHGRIDRRILNGIFMTAQAFAGNVQTIYFRAIGRLADIAAQAERAPDLAPPGGPTAPANGATATC
jgi:hypothetical protein